MKRTVRSIVEQCGISVKEAQLAALSTYAESAVGAEEMRVFSSVDQNVIAYFCAALFAGDEEDWFMDEQSETMLNRFVVSVVDHQRAGLPCKFLSQFCDLHGKAGMKYPAAADNTAIYFCEAMLEQMRAKQQPKVFPLINHVDIR